MKPQIRRNPGLSLCGLLLPNDGLIVSYMIEMIFPADNSFVIRSIRMDDTNQFMIEFLYLPLNAENMQYLEQQADNINKIFNLS